jgi:hypothetical protein
MGLDMIFHSRNRRRSEERVQVEWNEAGPVRAGSDQVKGPFGSDQVCPRGVQRGTW